jgi:hypothetical protein
LQWYFINKLFKHMNKEKIIEFLTRFPSKFRDLGDEYKNDYDIALFALQKDLDNMQYIPEPTRSKLTEYYIDERLKKTSIDEVVNTIDKQYKNKISTDKMNEYFKPDPKTMNLIQWEAFLNKFIDGKAVAMIRSEKQLNFFYDVIKSKIQKCIIGKEKADVEFIKFARLYDKAKLCIQD